MLHLLPKSVDELLGWHQSLPAMWQELLATATRGVDICQYQPGRFSEAPPFDEGELVPRQRA
jgi:hypothetical protein